MADEVTLVQYLFLRLHQLGVRSVHGVPGDYNLVALDYVEPSGLHWVGNANELNAGYAADGYARIKGMSALMTAFGVGELSALNAIGGAYAEKAPMVHIVGVPSTASQDQGLFLHHSFGDGKFRLNAEIYAKFTCAQANLRNVETAPATWADIIQYVFQPSTYDHRVWKTGLPVRSAVLKPHAALEGGAWLIIALTICSTIVAYVDE